jgi:hypothetical protein
VHNTLGSGRCVASKVVVRSIGKKDVGAKIDCVCRALEAPAEAGKRSLLPDQLGSTPTQLGDTTELPVLEKMPSTESEK